MKNLGLNDDCTDHFVIIRKADDSIETNKVRESGDPRLDEIINSYKEKCNYPSVTAVYLWLV